MQEKVRSFATLRDNMVAEQLESQGIRDQAVLAAMASVPREEFVLPVYRDLAYEDTPLPIWAGQTISQPFVVAYMIAALQLKPGDRVLEVGTGSGYESAVLSRIVREVYSIERHEQLCQNARRVMARLGYDNVRIRLGDGTCGWLEQAPFAAIIVSAGGPYVPPSLVQQLAVDGRLVMPVGRHTHQQMLVCYTKTDYGGLVGEELGPVAFVPLIGVEGWTEDSCHFVELAHTADVGLRVCANSLPALYACAAKAMFHMIDLQDDQENVVSPRTINVKSVDKESLLVDWLNELLYLHETTGEIYTYFRITYWEPCSLQAVVYGCHSTCAGMLHVKAVTYHQLLIAEEKDGWSAEIYFDI